MKKPNKLQRSDMTDARLAISDAIWSLNAAIEFLATCEYCDCKEFALNLRSINDELSNIHIDLTRYINGDDA